jgi:hypothetical protein
MGRGPHYSGKFIARAVELYYKGVKSGYVRWSESQNTLEEEFPSEFENKGRDKPSPETMMAWVRKYPDAHQHLIDLGMIKTDPILATGGTTVQLSGDQPLSPLPATRLSNIINDVMTCMAWIISVTFGVMMMELDRSWHQN